MARKPGVGESEVGKRLKLNIEYPKPPVFTVFAQLDKIVLSAIYFYASPKFLRIVFS